MSTPPTSFPPAGGYQTNAVATDVKQASDGTQARLAGRVLLWRVMGGLLFATLIDRSGTVQISLRRDEVGEERFVTWSEGVRRGDFIGVSGEKYVTRKGEPTLAVAELEILNRAQRPLPDKWVGVSNPEVRYRRRYLDLLGNPESRGRFEARSRLITAIRNFLDELDFLEIETPILQHAASGAAARPFITHHNALNEDFYLRIAPETYLKRAVAGGMERVYELGRLFRNEGMDSSHLQEFTSLEWYAAYWDYRDNMRVVRDMILNVMEKALGTTKITYQGVVLDFGAEWPEVDFREAVFDHTGIDLTTVRDVATLRERIRETYPNSDIPEAPSYAAMADTLYKRTVRPTLIQPCFLVHHPVELAPLARRSDNDPTRVDMFQVVVNTWELVKGYSELVDPVDQRNRFIEQQQMQAAGDEETMMIEEDFIEAMEFGMPPMSGIGIGIDRLTALLTDAPNLRDVVLFPSMRREND
ncbi:lysine--tRNA ligase [Streptomyces sp. NPDC056549]|uniref:lysine--tRNA ligase n=1 Tax=Streptomyces sp. NPDC056549 TaxID=3345864 RepID=UPI0036A98699